MDGLKPLLPSTPLTAEDWTIFANKLHTGCWPFCATLEWAGRNADRCDAALMRWLSVTKVMHYAELALPPEARLPIAHLWVRIDPEWPTGHFVVSL